MDKTNTKAAENYLKEQEINYKINEVELYSKEEVVNFLTDFNACKCEDSTWDKDAGCLICDNCGEKV